MNISTKIRSWSQALGLLLVVALLAISAGCAAQAAATAKQDESIIPALPAYNGPKARIAIGKFDWKVGESGGALVISTPNGNVTFGVRENGYMNGLSEMLTTALMKSGRFQVLESDLDPMKSEISLGQEGYVKEESKVQKGGWEGADLMVMAAVTSWEPDAGGSSTGLGGIIPSVPFIGGLKVGHKKSSAGMQIRIIDPRSRITLVSESISGEASSWNLGLGGGGILGGVGLLGGLSEYEKTPMGTAISVCIAKAVELTANQVPKEYFKH